MSGNMKDLGKGQGSNLASLYRRTCLRFPISSWRNLNVSLIDIFNYPIEIEPSQML